MAKNENNQMNQSTPNNTALPNQQGSLQNHLAGLPEDVQIERWEEHSNSIELFVKWKEPRGEDRRCPHCGSTRCVKKDKGTYQTVRHTPVGLSGTLVTFHKPRFKCRDCDKTFYLKPKWVQPNMALTTLSYFDIYSGLTSTSHSVKQIAIDTRTSVSLVSHVMDVVAPEKPKSLPVTIGIDEFHGRSGSYNPDTKHYDVEKYHCVITDIDAGYVIDILLSPNYRCLHNYFMEYPLFIRQKVKFFCTDMRSGFSKIARNCFPNARICIDMFHVVKLLTEAISIIRTDNWKRLRNTSLARYAQAEEASDLGDTDLAEKLKCEAKGLENDSSLIKASQKLLVTSPYNETAYWNQDYDRRDDRLKAIFKVVPDLKTAHEALMDFYDIENLNSFSERHKELEKWIDKYMAMDECPPVRQAAYSINIHRRGIENSWKFNKSNGPTEGLNKRIKDVKRMGFGAHDFENFRKRALLTCGSVTVYKSTYNIFDEKKTSPEDFTDNAEGGVTYA